MKTTLGIFLIVFTLFLISGSAIADEAPKTRVVIIPFTSEAREWKGPWEVDTLFNRSNLVQHDGSSYICGISHTSDYTNCPPSDYWDLIAKKGDDTGIVGPQGPIGPEGAQGPQGIQGDQGDQGNQGTQGLKGDQGDQGAQGTQGLKGDQGEKGDQGIQGLKGDQGDQGAQGTQGLKGDQGVQGAQGIQGPEGPAGAGGGASIYGDGSAGSVTISGNTDWGTDADYIVNKQFLDFTINVGVTLTVPSGTVIRCSDSFTNNGTLIVDYGLPAVGREFSATSPGNSERAAQSGLYGAGVAYSMSDLSMIFNPGLDGGGNGKDGTGGAALEANDPLGGAGGGSLIILAAGAVQNNAGAVIRANGANGYTKSDEDDGGSGGGAGGFIIIASTSTIINGGTIQANGGNAANAGAASNDGGGGGGGGGFVHLLSQNASSAGGTLEVTGGTAGNGVGDKKGSSGGSGGAMGGDGGLGGDGDNTNPSDPQNGFIGVVMKTNVSDPSSLFL